MSEQEEWIKIVAAKDEEIARLKADARHVDAMWKRSEDGRIAAEAQLLSVERKTVERIELLLTGHKVNLHRKDCKQGGLDLALKAIRALAPAEGKEAKRPKRIWIDHDLRDDDPVATPEPEAGGER